MYEKEHKLRQEAQGETTIVKGIGMNSPEMKEARAINKLHQELNGKLQTRLSEALDDNKRLSQQIDDYREMLRKAGL